WDASFDNGLTTKRAYPAFDTSFLSVQNAISADAVVNAQRGFVFSEVSGGKTTFQAVDPLTHTSRRFELPEAITDMGIAFATDRLMILPALPALSAASVFKG